MAAPAERNVDLYTVIDGSYFSPMDHIHGPLFRGDFGGRERTVEVSAHIKRWGYDTSQRMSHPVEENFLMAATGEMHSVFSSAIVAIPASEEEYIHPKDFRGRTREGRMKAETVGFASASIYLPDNLAYIVQVGFVPEYAGNLDSTWANPQLEAYLVGFEKFLQNAYGNLQSFVAIPEGSDRDEGAAFYQRVGYEPLAEAPYGKWFLKPAVASENPPLLNPTVVPRSLIAA